MVGGHEGQEDEIEEDDVDFDAENEDHDLTAIADLNQMGKLEYLVEREQDPYIRDTGPSVHSCFWNNIQHRVYEEILKVKKYKIAVHWSLDLEL